MSDWRGGSHRLTLALRPTIWAKARASTRRARREGRAIPPRRGSRRPHAAPHDDAGGEILDGEQAELGGDREDADVQRPELGIPMPDEGQVEGAGREHQPGPDVAERVGHIAAPGQRLDRHVASQPAGLQHHGSDHRVDQRRLEHHEARVVGDQRGAAEHHHKAQAQPLHRVDRRTAKLHVGDLPDAGRDPETGRDIDAVGDGVEADEQQGGEQVGGDPLAGVKQRVDARALGLDRRVGGLGRWVSREGRGGVGHGGAPLR